MTLKGGVTVDDRWALVMDEAWPTFQNSPPSHLVVQIQDEPGDAELREYCFELERTSAQRGTVGDDRVVFFSV